MIEKIKPGSVVSFDIYDSGSYELLIKNVTGTSVMGIILSLCSCYPNACYPSSIIPIVCTKEFDMEDPDIVTGSISVRAATYSDMSFEENAYNAQKNFLKSMVPAKAGHTYQELSFSIVKAEKENSVFCNMEITNIIDFEPEGVYKNPYVVRRTIYADSLEKMEEAYNTYASIAGIVIPETMIRFKFLHEHADEKLDELCSLSVPYSILRNQKFEVFPVDFDDRYKETIKDVLSFLYLHEDKLRCK